MAFHDQKLTLSPKGLLEIFYILKTISLDSSANSGIEPTPCSRTTSQKTKTFKKVAV